MENTLNVAAAASFSEASNITSGMAKKNHATIDFEIESLLLMNEPPYETNYYNAVEATLTNNATAPYKLTKDRMHNSRQSNSAGITINNNGNRNHEIYQEEWNTKNPASNSTSAI